MIGSIGVIVGGYMALGLPLPVSQAQVDSRFLDASTEHVEAEDRIKTLEMFARATRGIILRQDRRDVQIEIERYRDMITEGVSTTQTKRLIETLEQDVDALESQIRKLED